MIDCITRLLRQRIDYRTYKIIYHCHRCKKKIETYWDKDYTIKGPFKAWDIFFSEYLDIPVSDPMEITCLECLNIIDGVLRR
jgi:hypothetical protein